MDEHSRYMLQNHEKEMCWDAISKSKNKYFNLDNNDSSTTMTMKQFKHEIVMRLVGFNPLEEKSTEISLPSNHILLKNKNGKRLQCTLCQSSLKKKIRCDYSCIECKLGFHLECFSAHHNPHLMVENQEVSERVKTSLLQLMKKHKKSQFIQNISDLNLPEK